MLRSPALWAIGAYQRHLSPRKGYSCAYRLAYGGTGCSGFAKLAIADRGLLRALPQIRDRFAACKRAAQMLSALRHNQEDPKENPKSRWYDHCNPCDACSCPSGGKSGGVDCAPDCTPDCCSF